MRCSVCGRDCEATDHYNLGRKVPIYECTFCNEFYCWVGGVLLSTVKQVRQ